MSEKNTIVKAKNYSLKYAQVFPVYVTGVGAAAKPQTFSERCNSIYRYHLICCQVTCSGHCIACQTTGQPVPSWRE